MTTFLDAATILLPVAYLLVAIAYGFIFFAPQPLPERVATPGLRGTVLFHLAYLAGFWVDPISLGAGFPGYLLVRRDGHAEKQRATRD